MNNYNIKNQFTEITFNSLTCQYFEYQIPYKKKEKNKNRLAKKLGLFGAQKEAPNHQTKSKKSCR